MVGEDRVGELAIGHVDQGLAESRIQVLRERAGAVAEVCAGCALRPRCQYRCACRQLASSGQLGQLSSAFCDIEEAWVDAADAAAEQLVAEGCLAFQRFYYEQPWAPSPGAVPPQAPADPDRESGVVVHATLVPLSALARRKRSRQ